RLSDKDRIYVSGYWGRDLLFDETRRQGDTVYTNINWGNATFTTRWNHIFSKKLFANTSLIYSQYDYKVTYAIDRDVSILFSGINDWNGKIDFDYYPHPAHKIKFGLNYVYHAFTPNSVRVQTTQLDTIPFRGRSRFVHEAAAYVNDEISINEKLGFNLGIRFPFFKDETTHYQGIEPRATVKYSLGSNQSIKGGYTLMNQYVHLVSSSVISLPFDVWIPSSEKVKPQVAHQFAVGYFQNFLQDQYEGSIELYYKKMSNQIDYREGANFLFQDNIETELVFGNGWSYGAEFYLRKRAGRLTGWLGYTLSWTWRKFEDLNFGRPYHAKYDRRHDLSLVLVYKFNENWSFSSVFVYGSGHWLTSPSGKIFVPTAGWVNNYTWFNDFTARNDYRLKPYNRLDLGLRYEKKKTKYTSAWHIDFYNAYNRRNPFFVYLSSFRDPRANATQIVARQLSLLPMIPSVSYVFKF
ncbi:MAG: TonB-dependent receptor, partial [Bacteroidetes bacterium]|nr:TonB-dependent receptor [Bacteroidota bacterium]